MLTEFWWGTLVEREHLKDIGLDGKIIIKRIFKKWGGGHDWIRLGYCRDRMWSLMNSVMNLRVS